MLFGIIGLFVLCVGLDRLDKLERKAELKKAKEEGYEVYFGK